MKSVPKVEDKCKGLCNKCRGGNNVTRDMFEDMPSCPFKGTKPVPLTRKRKVVEDSETKEFVEHAMRNTPSVQDAIKASTRKSNNGLATLHPSESRAMSTKRRNRSSSRGSGASGSTTK